MKNPKRQQNFRLTEQALKALDKFRALLHLDKTKYVEQILTYPEITVDRIRAAKGRPDLAQSKKRKSRRVHKKKKIVDDHGNQAVVEVMRYAVDFNDQDFTERFNLFCTSIGKNDWVTVNEIMKKALCDEIYTRCVEFKDKIYIQNALQFLPEILKGSEINPDEYPFSPAACLIPLNEAAAARVKKAAVSSGFMDSLEDFEGDDDLEQLLYDIVEAASGGNQEARDAVEIYLPEVKL